MRGGLCGLLAPGLSRRSAVVSRSRLCRPGFPARPLTGLHCRSGGRGRLRTALRALRAWLGGAPPDRGLHRLGLFPGSLSCQCSWQGGRRRPSARVRSTRGISARLRLERLLDARRGWRGLVQRLALLAALCPVLRQPHPVTGDGELPVSPASQRDCVSRPTQEHK